MADIGTNVWGQQDWSNLLIESLVAESAVLRAPVTSVIVEGRTAHLPRVVMDPDADWVAELAELPSDAGDADVVVLEPKKIGATLALSRESVEDASVDQLDATGRSLVRGVASKLDARFFGDQAATALAPAGLRNYALPVGVSASITIESIVRAAGSIGAEGGVADAAFVAPADLTALRLEALNGGFAISDPTVPGIERVAGAQLIPTAGLPAGKAIVCMASYIYLGVRRDIAVEFSDQSHFTSDAIGGRVTARVDWEPVDLAAFVLIEAA
jgi:HK97 family phage major capsid protein